VKAGGNGPKTICSGLSPDKKAYCERAVEEQCQQPVKNWCGELHPKKDNKRKMCEAEANRLWTETKDLALRNALQNQAKRFQIDLSGMRPDPLYNIKDCAETVYEIVDKIGLPKSDKPPMPAAPASPPQQKPLRPPKQPSSPAPRPSAAKASLFPAKRPSHVTRQSTSKVFVEVKSKTDLQGLGLERKRTIFFIGDSGDFATEGLKKIIEEREGDSAVNLIFIERTNFSKEFVDYVELSHLFNANTILPQYFEMKFDKSGQWEWLIYNVTPRTPLEKRRMRDIRVRFAQLQALEALRARQKRGGERIGVSGIPDQKGLTKPAEEAKAKPVKEAKVKPVKEAKAKPVKKAKAKPVKEAKAKLEPEKKVKEPPAKVEMPKPTKKVAVAPVEPVRKAKPVEAEEDETTPKAGLAVKLTMTNFSMFFAQNKRPVVIAVAYAKHRLATTIGALQEEQLKKSEKEKAFIAILDINNKDTRQKLWRRIVSLEQEFPGMIDEGHIKPFTALTYETNQLNNRMVLKAYNGSVNVGTAPQPPRIPMLTQESYLQRLKRGELQYPITIFLTRDPTDGDFVNATRDRQGQAFYIDWSKIENRSFAMRYFGVSLTDIDRYAEWKFSNPNEQGYCTSWGEGSGGFLSIHELLDSSAFVEDPLQFRYVGNHDFDRFFGEKNREESIVVVGDPKDPRTQMLLQQISGEQRDRQIADTKLAGQVADEKSDTGRKKRLIMIPKSDEYNPSIILQRLIINNGKSKSPKAYTVQWNKRGKIVTKPYKPRGFETVRISGSNDVWKRLVQDTGENTLIVIGDTDETWNKSIAETTNKLRGMFQDVLKAHQEAGSADDSVRVQMSENRMIPVTKFVYISYADAQRLFRKAMENPKTEDVIPYSLKNNKALPQMFLAYSSRSPKGVKNREIEAVSMQYFNLKAAPVQAERVVAPAGQGRVDRATTWELGKGKSERKITAVEQRCSSQEFVEIKPSITESWQMSTEVVIVMGDRGSNAVEKYKKTVTELQRKCEIRSKPYFIDTAALQWNNKEYISRYNWLRNTQTNVLGIKNETGIYECRKPTQKSPKFTCTKRQ